MHCAVFRSVMVSPAEGNTHRTSEKKELSCWQWGGGVLRFQAMPSPAHSQLSETSLKPEVSDRAQLLLFQPRCYSDQGVNLPTLLTLLLPRPCAASGFPFQCSCAMFSLLTVSSCVIASPVIALPLCWLDQDRFWRLR